MCVPTSSSESLMPTRMMPALSMGSFAKFSPGLRCAGTALLNSELFTATPSMIATGIPDKGEGWVAGSMKIWWPSTSADQKPSCITTPATATPGSSSPACRIRFCSAEGAFSTAASSSAVGGGGGSGATTGVAGADVACRSCAREPRLEVSRHAVFGRAGRHRWVGAKNTWEAQRSGRQSQPVHRAEGAHRRGLPPRLQPVRPELGATSAAQQRLRRVEPEP